MQRYYLLTAAVVACFSLAVTWYLVDPPSFVLYTFKDLQARLVSSSSRGSSTTDSETTFAFYKFSLQWPPSTCTSKMNPEGPGLNCRQPAPAYFTIHGLWPQDAHDGSILPYNKDKSCTKLKPKTSSEIIDYLGGIEKSLEQLWPNLRDSESKKQNQDFWKGEWEKHGMCSDYAEKPFDYFNSSLTLRNGFNQLDPVFGLVPGRTYTVQEVADEVREQVKAKPEIACSTSRVEEGKLLLWEVRICYKKQTYPRPEAVQDCKRGFSRDCRKMTDSIEIPNPPRTPPASSTDESPNHLAGIGSDFQAGTDEM